MKKKLLTMLLPIMAMQAWAQESPDATAVNPLDFQSGDIWYTILDEGAKTCSTKAGEAKFESGMIKIYYGNDNTGAITIPATVDNNGVSYNVVEISEYSFGSASEVSIATGVETIKTTAFAGNASLTSISIPETVTVIGNNAFSGCQKLATVNIPSSVTVISNYTFSQCASLKSIVIPESVTSISDYAFSYSGLEDIVIPNNVTRLGTGAFMHCESLANVTLSENINAIPASAFSMSGLTSVTIPAGVTSIGAYAFNTPSLLEVTSLNTAIPAISANSFSSATYTQGVLNVYKSAIDAYKKSTLWQKFENIKEIEVQPTGIELNMTSMTLNLGLSGQLTATLTPMEASGVISWSVTAASPADVVDVDENGKVTAHKIGSATVTATCGNITASCDVTVIPNPSESVNITPLASTLYVGDKVTMSAVVLPSTITDPVVWSSSNEAVATIDANTGELTAIASGGAVISAECDGIVGKLSIVVEDIPVSSVTLDKTEVTLLAGETATLSATVLPANVVYPLTWESSDPTVAIVADGSVTAVGVGTATIRAMCGGVTANCVVTVNPTQAESVTLTTTAATMKVNQTLQLGATVMPETTTDKTITWTSSNPDVATVNTDGVVTALAVGEATITATCGTVSEKCVVTVEPTLASEVVINYSEITLKATQTQQLVATVPEDTTDKTIIWSSDNEDVATVSSEGLVTAVAVGAANITATCGSVSAVCVVTVESTPVEQIILDTVSATLNVGENLTVKAEVYPETATDKEITWICTPAEIASVENGVVTATAPGNAVVTASCGNVYASFNLTVLQPAKSISLNMENMELYIGEIEDLIATVDPENTTDMVSWSSSDVSVAVVNDHGIVTALAEGNATITAKCGEVSASCVVTVSPVKAESITLNATSITLKEKQSQQLIATVVPENTTYPTVTWTSEDESIATVAADGTVTAVSAGKTNIVAACGDVEAKCEVTVEAIEQDEIVINYSAIKLKVSETIMLTAIVPEDLEGESINWSSADENVATVNSDGMVTAVGVGQTTITVKVGDLTAECEVTVEPTLAEQITLNAYEVSLDVEETYQLIAIVLPSTTTDKTITWQSDNTEVVTVEDGMLTAIAPGTATVTAICGNVYASCTVFVNGDGTGIETTLQPEETVYMVFTIEGRPVMSTKDRDDLKRLAPGLYIINGKKIVRK